MTDLQPIEPRRAPVQHRPGPPSRRRVSGNGPSPKVKNAIHIMIWGAEDGIPLKRQDAAKAAGIADVTLRQSLGNPLTMRFFNEQLDVLRSGERPRSVHRIAELRDSAESERVQLEAAKYLDGGDKGSGVTVNVGLGVNVQAGYLIDVSQHIEAGSQLLKQARSTRNTLEDSHAVPTDGRGTVK